MRANEIEELKRLGEAVELISSPPPSIRVGAPRYYDRKVNYNELFKEAVEWYGKAIEVLKNYNVRAVIETHNGTIFISASLAYRLCSNFSPERIGVIYDVNNMIMDGYETPRLAMELLGPYFQHCHAGAHRPVPTKKLEDGTQEWQWEWCDFSEGLFNIHLLFSDMSAVNYTGFISIEDFRKTSDSKELLKRQLDYLKHVAKQYP